MSDEVTPVTSPVVKWYVQVCEQDVCGPCNETILKSLLDSAVIDGFTNVWCEGMAAWKPISQVDELKLLLIDVDDEETKTALLSAKAEQNVDEKQLKKRAKKKLYLQRKRQRIQAGEWVRAVKNTSVYVTGLPNDTTLQEVADTFKKAGVLKIDPITTLPKVKLYTNDQGILKGDAKVTFVNRESVDFAVRYLDDYYFRQDCIINVQEAQYEQGNNTRVSKPILSDPEMKKRYLAARYEEKRLASWGDDQDDGTGRRIVVCKPMFTRDQAEMHEASSDFYKQLVHRVSELIGALCVVEKITPIARHPQGIVCIKFKDSADAELFITHFKNRNFEGRALDCFFFDGKSDFASQTIPSKNIPAHAAQSVKTKDNDNEYKCGWIDEQSSDEEFEIRTE